MKRNDERMHVQSKSHAKINPTLLELQNKKCGVLVKLPFYHYHSQ